jgi:hypothetical protein
VHFLLGGALLFVIFAARGNGRASTRIVITPGRLEHLSAGFLRTWQRLPDERELEGLLRDYVREEIAAREGAAMGLDEDDAVIRRRLRQKFEFLVEDALEAAPPSDGELAAWFESRRERFREEPRVAFRQEFQGDLLSLPLDFDLVRRSDVVALFGEAFAESLLAAPLGRWAGPFPSGYGLHRVLVRERRMGGIPDLAAARPDVEREFMAERRRKAVDDLYERLLRKYTVIVKPPVTEAVP